MKRTTKILALALFCFYLLILVWVILLKMGFSFREPDPIRKINWTPLAESYYPDGRLNLWELINNVLFFVPLGIYFTLLWRDSPVPARIAAACGVSLLLESLQYILSIGVSDITDLLTNTAGGAIGVGLSEILYRTVKKESLVDKLLVAAALAGSLCFAGLALLLLLAN